MSVCVFLNEPTQDNFVHVADISMETNMASDVIISLTTTSVDLSETCNDAGLVIVHHSEPACSHKSISVQTCDITGTGSVSEGLLLCNYTCPCGSSGCSYGLYYEQYKHYLHGDGTARELCRVEIQE